MASANDHKHNHNKDVTITIKSPEGPRYGENTRRRTPINNSGWEYKSPQKSQELESVVVMDKYLDYSNLFPKQKTHARKECPEDRIVLEHVEITDPLVKHILKSEKYIHHSGAVASDEGTESWTEAVTHDKDPVLPLPRFPVRYRGRIRSKCLQFTLKAPVKELKVNEPLAIQFPPEYLVPALYDCKNNDHNHRIVPLRLSVSRYHSYHTPPTRLKVQLCTDGFSFSQKEAEKEPVRIWTPALSYSADGTNSGYELQWDTHHDAMKEVMLYQADESAMTPVTFEWLHILTTHPKALLDHLREVQRVERDKQNPSQVLNVTTELALEQPDWETNKVPNLFSYALTSNIRTITEGMSEHTLQTYTFEDQEGTRFWRFPLLTYEKVAAEMRANMPKLYKDAGMNLYNGMTLQLTPSDVNVWNVGARLKPNEPMDVNVTIRMDYVVIGHP